MSTDATPPAPTGAPAKPKKILLIVVVVLGLVVGGGGGAFVAAPLLAGKPAAAAPAADSAAGADDADEKDEQGAGTPIVHLVDNLVLNPANSGGSRFLLFSVGLSVKDEAVVKKLQDRDPELRDVLLGVLGARTIDELTDVARRDSLKTELRTAVRERFGAEAAREIYFPQFVIQ